MSASTTPRRRPARVQRVLPDPDTIDLSDGREPDWASGASAGESCPVEGDQSSSAPGQRELHPAGDAGAVTPAEPAEHDHGAAGGQPAHGMHRPDVEAPEAGHAPAGDGTEAARVRIGTDDGEFYAPEDLPDSFEDDEAGVDVPSLPDLGTSPKPSASGGAVRSAASERGRCSQGDPAGPDEKQHERNQPYSQEAGLCQPDTAYDGHPGQRGAALRS